MKTPATQETALPATGDGGSQLDAYVTTGESPPVHEQVKHIELGSLLDEEGNFRTVQVREKVDQTAVDDYATAMRDGRAGQFPPIVVYDVTDRDGMRYLAAGLHRSSAARQAGLTTIRGEVRQGTWHEALEAAIATNATHGHRPTFEDVCETLLRMHEDEQLAGLSNVKKAEKIGVSEGTVRNAYRHLEKTSHVTRSGTVMVVKKDGTRYDLPTPAAAVVATSHVTRSAETAAATKDGAPSRTPSRDPAPRIGAAVRAVGDLVSAAHKTVERLRQVGLNPDDLSDEVLARCQLAAVEPGTAGEADDDEGGRSELAEPMATILQSAGHLLLSVAERHAVLRECERGGGRNG